ncbi:MAG: HNH endonuclease [bacterium]
MQFTASAETVKKLRLAQELLRHQIPDGDPAAIFDRALTALLDTLARRKLAATERPRVGRGTAPRSRHIPAAVRRAVWRRDGGCCAFVSRQGRRCAEGGFLEFHHIAPYAAGGEATADNIQLRCRAHNGYEAELYFGPRHPERVKETRASYLAPNGQPRWRPGLGIVTTTRSGPSSEPALSGRRGELG